VPVTQIDATHFSFEYAALDAQPIIVEVDPVTNTTSIANQYFGIMARDLGNLISEAWQAVIILHCPASGFLVLWRIFILMNPLLEAWGILEL